MDSRTRLTSVYGSVGRSLSSVACTSTPKGARRLFQPKCAPRRKDWNRSQESSLGLRPAAFRVSEIFFNKFAIKIWNSQIVVVYLNIETGERPRGLIEKVFGGYVSSLRRRHVFSRIKNLGDSSSRKRRHSSKIYIMGFLRRRYGGGAFTRY